MRFHRVLEHLNLFVLLTCSFPVAILGYFDTATLMDSTQKVYMYLFMVLRVGSFAYLLAIYLVFLRLLFYFKHRKEEQYQLKRLSDFQFNLKKSIL
jgi:hypothetical protein